MRKVELLLLTEQKKIYFIYQLQKSMQAFKKYLAPSAAERKEHLIGEFLLEECGVTVSVKVFQHGVMQMGDSQTYQFDKSCLLAPAYQGRTLTKLTVWKDYACCRVVGQGQHLQHLYKKLTRQLSHKGFSQYFKPLKRLGRGTFATVYMVEHKFTGNKKAAKVFSREGQKIQLKGNEALQNEIEILKDLDHPNILHFDGIYETESLVYVVTEYLSGGTLEQTLRKKCLHTGELIQNIIRDLLTALCYLNQQNIMHRDIKPQNVIYREDDSRWVLTDFGLAARTNRDYLYDKCGTMGYMAPEIMEHDENEKYTQTCDMYSLGIIAYQLIIGELPFRVERENFFDHKLVWLLFQREQCKKINKKVRDFLEKMLEKDPKFRIQPKYALQHQFFTNQAVKQDLFQYHARKKEERFQRILKLANNN